MEGIMDKWTELKKWTKKEYTDLKKEYEDDLMPDDDLEISEDEMVGIMKGLQMVLNKIRLMETQKNLNDEFNQCTGTQAYYQGFGNIKYTDGIKIMADKFNAHWLIDVVSSYQTYKAKGIPFQIWTIKSTGEKAVVEMIEDTGKPVLIRQKVNFTDFPQGILKMYCIDGILLLPSEC
jgi:hypothetical protein